MEYLPELLSPSSAKQARRTCTCFRPNCLPAHDSCGWGRGRINVSGHGSHHEDGSWSDHDIMTTTKQRKDFEEFLELTSPLKCPCKPRFRVNAFTRTVAPVRSYRTIPSKVLSMDVWGMGHVFKKISMCHASGCWSPAHRLGQVHHAGRRCLDYLNNTNTRHVLTIEDPDRIVSRESEKVALVNQRGSDRDHPRFC